MKKALKGALISGLVFPGLGHIALKRYTSGIALIITVTAGVVFMVMLAVQKAFGLLDAMQSGGKAIDMKSITDAASRAASHSDDFLVSGAWILLLLCWIVGVVDAYRIGKQKDLEELNEGRSRDEGLMG